MTVLLKFNVLLQTSYPESKTFKGSLIKLFTYLTLLVYSELNTQNGLTKPRSLASPCGPPSVPTLVPGAPLSGRSAFLQRGLELADKAQNLLPTDLCDYPELANTFLFEVAYEEMKV